jgi:4-alpha-glucanotransferase
MKIPRALRTLADLYGVQLEYTGFSGERMHAQPDAVLAVLRSLGADVNELADVTAAIEQRRSELARVSEPVVVAWDGQLSTLRLRVRSDEKVNFELYLEDGSKLCGALRPRGAPKRGSTAYSTSLREPLPLGYHELAIESATWREHISVIAAPQRAHSDEEKRCGVFLPLYALRSQRMHGIASFQDLLELTDWAGENGAALVGTLPLLASFLETPFEPSPYSPVSRLFWNELFIDLGTSARNAACLEASATLNQERFASETARLNSAELVDYKAAAALKRSVLEPLARCFFARNGQESAEFRAFLAQHQRVEDYAAFRAVTERQRKGWWQWPEPLRAGNVQPADYDRARYQYHLFVQFEAARQLQALSSNTRARIYLDLPLGVNSNGYDVWRERDLFATGVAAGAPPDAFFTQGQNWGFPPMIPDALRADSYAYLREALHAHLRYAGALRLDHVMSLYRLYWVPNGYPATEGVYVHYPAEELHAVLTLESVRHNAAIIGEDLGVVPPEVRQRMKKHNLLRMYVVQFEARPSAQKPLPDPPAHSVASLNTHDMPPFAAYHAGLDADLRAELGLLDAEQTAEAHQHRALLMRKIERQLEQAGYLQLPTTADQVRDALLAFLASSDAELVLVNLEDLWEEIKPQNVPGTAEEKPNWQRRAQLSLEEIVNSAEIHAILSRLNSARRTN